MLRDFRAVADQNGIPGSRLHFEDFKSDAERAKDGGFTVVLQRSGSRSWLQAGQTILEALQDVGIEVSYSCMEGICGFVRDSRYQWYARSPGHGALGT